MRSAFFSLNACTICIGLLSQGTLATGQTFSVVPSTIDGVELIAPDSPDFGSLAAARIQDAGARSAMQPALGYSVIIRNASARPLRAIALRMDQLNRLGKPIRSLWVLRYTEGEFGASAFELVTPAGPSREASHPGSSAAIQQRLDLMRVSPWIKASLDAVVYEDGEFAGPDVSGTFDAMVREGAETRRLLQDLQAMENQPNQVIIAYLDKVISAPPVSLGEGRRVIVPQRTARTLKTQLASGLREKFTESLREMTLHPGVLDVWRRGR